MFDTHVHSTFSPDGNSSILEYIHVIDEGKLKGIGFTEHLDFMPECGAFQFLDYKAYRNTIENFREKGYSLYMGAEIDYAKRVEKDILDLLGTQSYDYTISSIHMIQGLAVSDRRELQHFADPTIFLKMLENYYVEITESTKVPEFDVIGHIGVYRRYLTKEFFENHPYKDLILDFDNQLAEVCAKSEKIVEVNTSGLFAESKSTMPHIHFLKAYFEAGGRTVSIGSDAHHQSHAGRGFAEAKEILKAIGFKYIFLPWEKNKPQKIE